jgi:hypothetical protein
MARMALGHERQRAMYMFKQESIAKNNSKHFKTFAHVPSERSSNAEFAANSSHDNKISTTKGKTQR